MKDPENRLLSESPDTQERLLLTRLIAGDIAGYEVLFHKYYPTFHYFIKNMVKDSFIAEDIAQNIFMKVWVNREKLDPDKSIRNYLFVLARNEIYNYFRVQNRAFASLREAMQQGEALSSSNSNEIEERLDLNETTIQVEQIVDKMPQQRQLIFRLSRFDHLSNKEIAGKLNISVRTVDKHLELAIRELRRHISAIPVAIILFNILP